MPDDFDFFIPELTPEQLAALDTEEDEDEETEEEDEDEELTEVYEDEDDEKEEKFAEPKAWKNAKASAPAEKKKTVSAVAPQSASVVPDFAVDIDADNDEETDADYDAECDGEDEEDDDDDGASVLPDVPVEKEAVFDMSQFM